MIQELLEEKRYEDLHELIKDEPLPDIVEYIEDSETTDKGVLFRLLPKDLAVDVFSELSGFQQRELISSFSESEITEITEQLPFDDRIDFLEEMPAHLVRKILSNANPEYRALVNRFLNYPADSAGSLMTIEFIKLNAEMTVGEALDFIKHHGDSKETIYTSYVTDDYSNLLGIVSLRELVVQENDVVLKDIMHTDFVVISAYDDQEEVAQVFKDYGFIAMPVVDKEGRILGIITVDDVIDVIDDEATEDFQRMAAITPSNEEYLETSVFSMAKRRFSWLLFMMISAMITGTIIERYESVLSSVLILASFMPMLMNTAGNAGSQASTMVIRGMSLGELRPKDTLKILKKELGIALLVGVLLAVINLLRLMFFNHAGLLIGLTVSTTVFCTVILAKLLGAVLPIIADRLNLDPAIMAAPMITTVVDALSLLIYFTIATRLLGLG